MNGRGIIRGWDNYGGFNSDAILFAQAENYIRSELLHHEDVLVGDICLTWSVRGLDARVEIGAPGELSLSELDTIHSGLCKIFSSALKVTLRIVRLPFEKFSARLLAEWAAIHLKDRVTTESVISVLNEWYTETAYTSVQSRDSEVLGILTGMKIELRGRIDGNEEASKNRYQYGEIPLQGYARTIEFGEARGYAEFGVLGVRIWLAFISPQGYLALTNPLPMHNPALDSSLTSRKLELRNFLAVLNRQSLYNSSSADYKKALELYHRLPAKDFKLVTKWLQSGEVANDQQPKIKMVTRLFGDSIGVKRYVVTTKNRKIKKIGKSINVVNTKPGKIIKKK